MFSHFLKSVFSFFIIRTVKQSFNAYYKAFILRQLKVYFLKAYYTASEWLFFIFYFVKNPLYTTSGSWS